jgi:predicted transcriptional regulator
MKQVKNVAISVGGKIKEEATKRFVDAWHRAEKGQRFHERHLAFESWDALARVPTGKRMELLRYVHRHEVESVRALAKALKRDYSNVHGDVQALAAAGLIDTEGGVVRADYDAIETRIAI